MTPCELDHAPQMRPADFRAGDLCRHCGCGRDDHNGTAAESLGRRVLLCPDESGCTLDTNFTPADELDPPAPDTAGLASATAASVRNWFDLLARERAAAVAEAANARVHAEELSGLVDALAARCCRQSECLTRVAERGRDLRLLLAEVVKRSDPCLIAPDGWCDTHQGCPCVLQRAKDWLGVRETLDVEQVG